MIPSLVFKKTTPSRLSLCLVSLLGTLIRKRPDQRFFFRSCSSRVHLLLCFAFKSPPKALPSLRLNLCLSLFRWEEKKKFFRFFFVLFLLCYITNRKKGIWCVSCYFSDTASHSLSFLILSLPLFLSLISFPRSIKGKEKRIERDRKYSSDSFSVKKKTARKVLLRNRPPVLFPTQLEVRFLLEKKKGHLSQQ